MSMVLLDLNLLIINQSSDSRIRRWPKNTFSFALTCACDDSSIALGFLRCFAGRLVAACLFQPLAIGSAQNEGQGDLLTGFAYCNVSLTLLTELLYMKM